MEIKYSALLKVKSDRKRQLLQIVDIIIKGDVCMHTYICIVSKIADIEISKSIIVNKKVENFRSGKGPYHMQVDVCMYRYAVHFLNPNATSTKCTFL